MQCKTLYVYLSHDNNKDMKEQEFKYVLDRIKNVEVPNNEEVQSENIIDGLVESVEYTPIQVEGVIFEIESNDGNYVFQFDYDEINTKNNALINIELNGEMLDLTICQYIKIESKLFNNIKFA